MYVAPSGGCPLYYWVNYGVAISAAVSLMLVEPMQRSSSVILSELGSTNTSGCILDAGRTDAA